MMIFSINAINNSTATPAESVWLTDATGNVTQKKYRKTLDNEQPDAERTKKAAARN